MADVCITEYTDPGCPWAYSAEPFRRRLTWLYGDALEWQVARVALAGSPQEYLDKGFTPEKQSASFKKISHDHHMPIDTSVRERLGGAAPAPRPPRAGRRRPAGGAHPRPPRGHPRPPARARRDAPAAAPPAHPPLLRRA